MLSFLVPLVFAGVFLLVSIILTIASLIKNGNDKYGKIGAIFSALSGVVMLFLTPIPKPEIFISDDIKAKNEEKIKITINSKDGVFKTYYSLDGTDPKNGIKYKKEIYITKSTTICAKNNFLFLWSDVEKESFDFENSYTESGKESTELTEHNNDEIVVVPTPTISSDIIPTSTPKTTNKVSTTKDSIKIKKGQNPNEAKKLMKYINNYRKKKGLSGLKWNVIPEKEAKKIAKQFAQDKFPIKSHLQLVARRCNGAKNAEKVVSDWINGNQYISSESSHLLKKEYTMVGGALYYLPNGDKNNYHYFWVVCFY